MRPADLFSMFLCIVCALVLTVNGSTTTKKALPRTNLLFIMFDDLRPELSIYGKKHMHTPNFERLAAKSVTFDLCITQVAVCNPSRDSLLTGLRPDTMGNYAFQTTYYPNPVFMQHLITAGYKTSSYGKIRHWDGKDPSVWSHENFEGDWYTYQNWEWDHMNSTVMPDKVRDEKTFPDYIFTSRAIANLRHFNAEKNHYYMTALGFKMPHTALHVPYEYYDMYKKHRHVWRGLEAAGRTFPPSAPAVSWRCCADGWFKFMNEEGAKPHKKTEELEDMKKAMSSDLYEEMMQGYSAAITFTDKQLGRLLDVMDELDLWKNTTVILTADHGMHNGEKGLWEKWTLFDEATRVPLLIAHPLSPFKGKHYKEPVELVDVFPTVFDLTNAPVDRKTLMGAGLDSANGGGGGGGGRNKDPAFNAHLARLVQPGGKSLASVVLGNEFQLPSWTHKGQKHAHALIDQNAANSNVNSGELPKLAHTFGLSQTWKCAVAAMSHIDVRKYAHMRRQKIWKDCDINNRTEAETSLMGYSMRTSSFRYTAWVHFDRVLLLPEWDRDLFTEELYDHRGEELGSLTRYELVNVAKLPEYQEYVVSHRDMLLTYLQSRVVYRNGHKMPHYNNATLIRVRGGGASGGGGIGDRKHHRKEGKSVGGAGGSIRRRLQEVSASGGGVIPLEFVQAPDHAVVKERWWD